MLGSGLTFKLVWMDEMGARWHIGSLSFPGRNTFVTVDVAKSGRVKNIVVIDDGD